MKVASLDTLLQIAMDQAKHLIRADYCAVMLIDVDRMEFVETYHPAKVLCSKPPIYQMDSYLQFKVRRKVASLRCGIEISDRGRRVRKNSTYGNIILFTGTLLSGCFVF